jgi:predicted O-methyltransferase YrrM
LFVTDTNLLDDSVESAGYLALLRAISGLGLPGEAVCRFIVPAEQDTEPAAWLTARGWHLEAAPGGGEAARPAGLRVNADGLDVRVFLGPTAQTHAPDEAEQAAFLGQVAEAVKAHHPDVVVARSGPSMPAVLDAARGRQIATVCLQPDCAPRDQSAFRSADVVLTPTRLAAEYLREALGLPCADLPPVVDRPELPVELQGHGTVVFDGTAPAGGLSVFGQIATEVNRQRPSIRFVALGGTGVVPLPNGGRIQCAPREALEAVWNDAQVFLAPQLRWEHPPLTALSALGYGVPVVASDRGAAPELLEGAALLLPLPDRVTGAVPLPLRPAERAPWVATLLRLYEDPAFAAAQRSLARLAGPRWSAASVAPRYAQFLARLAERRRPHLPVSGNGVLHNGEAKAVHRLAEAHAWPAQCPEDPAPGQEQGWLGEGTELMLAQALSPKTRVVVELGAWLGMSTRYIADHAPQATVISVDHWRGSPEHQTQEHFQKLLPRLYETFQARCWDYRERVVPLKMTTLDGLRAVAEAGVEPDLVFVDAEHSYEAVTAELTLIRQLFPGTTVGGDDYDWQEVREAVDRYARRHALVVDRFGARGWRLVEGWDAADAREPSPGRSQWAVLVPHMSGIDWECEQALRRLEAGGVRVVRRGGCSAIDVARNEMLSGALHGGAESILFIDSDIGFDPADALRLLARPEPVVAGVYAKKGVRELASIFVDGTREILFGPEAPGLYPLKYAATGFLRVRAGALRRMIAELQLPLCNTHWGRGVWPFFLPLVVPHGPGKCHYLGEDWAFSHRLGQMGVTPLADTSIRLWHWGRYSFSWEDAGTNVDRYRSYSYRLEPA